MPNRQTTSEELFATNNVKDAQELKNAIFQNLAFIGENSDKLDSDERIFYSFFYWK